jgi:hypothetical protein
MTICIAASCAAARAIVVASDRMLSAPFLTLEFDHPDAKIDEISTSCVALSAGDALTSHEVLSEDSGPAGQLHDPDISDFVSQIRQRFVAARKRLANEQILEPRGLSFEQFYQRGGISSLPPDLAMMIDDEIQRMRLDVSIIVAGVDRAGPHIFSIEDPGTSACYDRLSYHAIGSGHRHAMLSLVAHNQHLRMGLNQTVFNVFCAKKAAEAAPGVGQATEMRIITRDEGIKNLSVEELNLLLPLYEKKMKPKLVEIEKAVNELPYEGKGSRDEKDGAK